MYPFASVNLRHHFHRKEGVRYDTIRYAIFTCGRKLTY